jgi:nucleotide-binding universal stress UspA family protein
MEKKKILVLVDGSERSLNTIRFLSEFAPLRGMQLVLFNVFHKVPDYYWDLSNEPMMAGRAPHMASWEAQNRQSIDQFMEKAVAMLRTSGFKSEDVVIKVENRVKGVARDIIAEASRGYMAVVARRRGFTKVPGLLMGSVADKLLVSLGEIPLFFAGVEPVTEKILIPMDSSESSVNAVRFVADIAGESGYSVTLFHVVRENEIFSDESYGDNPAGRKVMLEAFEQAKAVLVESGVNAENIKDKVITGEGSRAGSIARYAAENGISTIVMGRQGVSKVREFFLGRVSKKVLYAAHKNTVCLV